MFNGIEFKGDANEKTAKFETYWSVLRELPAAAIVAACNDVLKGRVGNPDFLPTCGRLFEQAEKHVLNYRSKPRRIAEPIVRDTQPKEPFDPSATTFSTYKLGMSMEQIIAGVGAYRNGLAIRGNP